MRKHLFLSVIALLMVFVLMAATLVGCKKDEPKDDGKKEDDKVTVGWYNGTELLKEEKITKGSKVTSWTPEVTGKTFMGWFSESSLTESFDFDTVINEDTDIFAGFRTDSFTEDTNTWVMIGTGAGTLKGSNWSELPEVEENFKLTRVNEDGVNKFTITATLYEGDAFQFRILGTWNGQHGAAYLAGYTVLETPDGEVLGEVKNEAGERVFYAIKGFGDSPKGWNAVVAKSGIYEFTLQTFPGSNDYDVVSWTRTGDAPTIDITHDMFVMGTMNNFQDDDDYKMETDNLRETFTFILNITEEMYADWTMGEGNAEKNPFGEICAAIKVKNAVSGTWYGVSEQAAGEDGVWHLTASGQDNLFLQAGQYKITYSVADNEATVTKLSEGYFLAGVLDGEDSWKCSKNHPMEKISDTVWRAFYTFTADDCKDWMQGGVGAVKVAYGYSDCDPAKWFGTPEGENIMIPSAGLYEIRLTLDEEGNGVVTVTKLTGYYLVGTIKGGDTWRADIGNEMSEVDGKPTLEYTFTENDTNSWCAPDVAAIKVILVAEDGTVTWYGNAGENVMIPELGTYVIVLDGEQVTATKK